MPKKRVHEIAKEQGIPAKELIAKLQAAGIEAKAPASTVEEASALKALGGSGVSAPEQASNGFGGS
jgi:translation initiation factor IF-2